jgi:hypothetical protein
MKVFNTSAEGIRERPPDHKRERRPAGTERQIPNAQQSIGDSDTPIHSLAKLQAQANRRRRRQRMAELVWKLGARAFFEFIDELDRHYGLNDDLDRRLERFANADPALIALFGGDQFPAGPTRIIEDGR